MAVSQDRESRPHQSRRPRPESSSTDGTTTTYPSTLSSIRDSTLGLTDSPAIGTATTNLNMSSNSTAPESPPSRIGQQQRNTRSKSNLRTSVHYTPPEPTPDSRPQRPNGDAGFTPSGRTSAIPPRPTTTAFTSHQMSQRRGVPKRTLASAIRGDATKGTRNEMEDFSMPDRMRREGSTPAKQGIGQSRQQRGPEGDQSQRQTSYIQPTPMSPAKTEDTMAEDWEDELVRNAKRLNLSGRVTPKVSSRDLAKERDEQRQKDAEWARSGLWETSRDAARDAEDRVRREAGREIAYPPTQPRIPIRAAPSGVTSVHVGVRPRLHPSRASDSMLRNQPDANLGSPARSGHSPLQASQRGNIIKDEITLSKAQEQYEQWLKRKAEREGGMNEEENSHGTRDWIPKDRVVARPGAVEGYAHSEGYGDARLRAEPIKPIQPSLLPRPVQPLQHLPPVQAVQASQPSAAFTSIVTPPETATLVHPWNGYEYTDPSLGYPQQYNQYGYENFYGQDPMMYYPQGMWDPQTGHWGQYGGYPQEKGEEDQGAQSLVQAVISPDATNIDKANQGEGPVDPSQYYDP